MNNKGKNNPNYRHGKTFNNHCLDCNTLLGNYRSKRCHSCAKKYQYLIRPETHPMKGKTGELHPNWKGGKTHNNKCINCGQKIMFSSKRCPQCHGNTIKNENNPNWRDGLSRIPYSLEWTNDLKESIRKRDNYICQLCYKKGNQVHHIDYNKKKCNKNNLITLCRKCHCKSNFNRDYWFAYFMYLMENK